MTCVTWQSLVGCLIYVAFVVWLMPPIGGPEEEE